MYPLTLFLCLCVSIIDSFWVIFAVISASTAASWQEVSEEKERTWNNGSQGLVALFPLLVLAAKSFLTKTMAQFTFGAKNVSQSLATVNLKRLQLCKVTVYIVQNSLFVLEQSVCLLSHERRREPQRGIFFLLERLKIPLDLPNSDFLKPCISVISVVDFVPHHLHCNCGRKGSSLQEEQWQQIKTLSMYIWACEYLGQAWKNANT